MMEMDHIHVHRIMYPIDDVDIPVAAIRAR